MLLHDGGSVSVLRLPLVLRCAVNTASLTPVSLHAPRAQLQHVYVPRFHLAASAGALVRLQRQRLACQDSQRAGQGISSPSPGSRLWSGSATLTAARGLEVNHAVLPLWKHATRLLLQPPILARRQEVLHHVPRPAIPCFSSCLSTLLSKHPFKNFETLNVSSKIKFVPIRASINTMVVTGQKTNQWFHFLFFLRYFFCFFYEGG